jgi:hypothetical protein
MKLKVREGKKRRGKGGDEVEIYEKQEGRSREVEN